MNIKMVSLCLRALVLSLILLGGCSLAPGYTRPETALPEAFSGDARSGDARSGNARSGGENRVPDAANRLWWATFASKALPELQRLALDNNHAFAAERWLLSQKLSQVRSSRSALFPSVELGLNSSRQGGESPAGYTVKDAYSGSLQVKYELDLWGKNSDTATSAAFSAEAGLNAWRGAGLSLESEVALTYFAMLAAQANLRVYDAMLNNAREVLVYQEKRAALGAAEPLEVARQRNSVQSMEAERMGYRIKIDEARNSLCLLLGVATLPATLESAVTADSLMVLLPPAISPGLPSQLLARRPDIAEAEARLQSANADIGVARAAFLPVLNLTVTNAVQSDQLTRFIAPESALYTLAASLVQPIFSGGRQLAQLDLAVAVKEELIERYRQASLAAFWEASTALNANDLLATQELFRVEASRQAAEAYRIARAQYEAGAQDYLSLLTAQDSMLSAESSLVQTRLQRLNSVVALFKALGGGWGVMPPELVLSERSPR